MRIKFDTELVKTMNLFQAITKTTLKDAIDEEGHLMFIVQPGEIARAVGKGGSNVKTLERKLNRKIKIVEFNSQLIRFVQNLIYPIKPDAMEEQEGIVTIMPPNLRSRGLLIGRNAQNLRRTEKVVKRYFDITEIKVK